MTSSLSSTEAVIELVTDDDQVTVAGPGAPWEEHGIALDQSPDGMFSTAFNAHRFGAFQIGGRFAGHDIPVREMVRCCSICLMSAMVLRRRCRGSASCGRLTVDGVAGTPGKIGGCGG